jgi:hypothetical protein
MVDRCTLSDLKPSECGCRIHARVKDDPPEVPRVFVARYDGCCRECTGLIFPGDTIVAVEGKNGGYVHVGCSGE